MGLNKCCMNRNNCALDMWKTSENNINRSPKDRVVSCFSLEISTCARGCLQAAGSAINSHVLPFLIVLAVIAPHCASIFSKFYWFKLVLWLLPHLCSRTGITLMKTGLNKILPTAVLSLLPNHSNSESGHRDHNYSACNYYDLWKR